MKKIYFLFILLLSISFTGTGQIIDDNMDSYTLGPIGTQAAHWSTWSGTAGAEDIEVVNTQSNSGSQSGFIGAGPGPQDAMLLLGDQTTGNYRVEWMMYIPGGKGAYYNFQEFENVGSGNWAINVTFDGAQTVTVTDDANPANAVGVGVYPENTWFLVTNIVNVDADTVIVEVNGTEIYNGDFYSGGFMGGVDFFGTDANNEYYVDDVFYDVETLGTDEFDINSFTAYPNPVVDQLNIRSIEAVDNIVVYDILGKQVLMESPGRISPTIDMSRLASGAYLVKVFINGSSKTIKVIK